MAKHLLTKPKHGDKGHKFWHTSFWLKWDVALKVEGAARAAGISTSEAVHQILSMCVGQFPSKGGKTNLEPSMRGVEKKKVKVKKVARKVYVAKAKKPKTLAAKIQEAKPAAAQAVKKAVKESKMTDAQREAKNKGDRERRAAKKTKPAEVVTKVEAGPVNGVVPPAPEVQAQA